MKLSFYPGKFVSKRCLIMVGGAGDTAERFTKIVHLLSRTYQNSEICTFTLTENEVPSLTHDIQVQEVEHLVDQLIAKYHFQTIDIFCTSMGAYATSFLVSNAKYSQVVGRVIFFDPADYYLDHQLANEQGDSWTGFADYQPIGEVASDQLKKINSSLIAHVVHLIVRNYGQEGYLYQDYKQRSLDIAGQYPRISTKMVKSFFEKLPAKNRGKYLEINHLPHGFLRDGNIEENQARVAQIVSTLLLSNPK